MAPPLGLMGRSVSPLFLSLLMVLTSLSGCIFEDDTSASGELLAVFSFSPSNNNRVGDEIKFDASASMPQDGSLTYRWNFDAIGSQDIDATGQSAYWTYDTTGEYTVSLTISDGTRTSEQTRKITISEEDAQPPNAEIYQFADAEDCDNNEITDSRASRSILVWICEYDISHSDRTISATTKIDLDASDSSAGDSSQYIAEYRWDLNLNDDKDNDGDAENDDDLTGETVSWNDVKPGEYKIGLTVVNNVGMIDSTTMTVIVCYAGYWPDFEMAGNTSGSPVELDFDVFVNYDKTAGNTIQKLVAELEYPEQDDDWVVGGNAQQNRNKLDIFAYNEEDDEVSNTTETDPDSREDGDCNDDEQDCIHLTLSSYLFTDTESTYGDGEWTLTIRNGRFNDITVDQFVIRIFY